MAIGYARENRRVGDPRASAQRSVRATKDAQGARRDPIHYDQKYGSAMSNEGRVGLDKNQSEFAGAMSRRREDFAKSVADTRGQIATGRSDLASSYESGMKSLNSARDTALGALPDKMTLSGAYNDWRNTWVKIGFEDNGKIIGYNYLPKEVYNDYLQKFNKEGVRYFRGDDGVMYQKIHGITTEVGTAIETIQNEANSAFYKTAAPQISKSNKSIDDATGSINSQYYSQRDKMNSDAAAARGTFDGSEKALESSITTENTTMQTYTDENAKNLAGLRQSYTDRLSRIDQALNMTVGQPQQTQQATPQQAAPQQNNQISGVANYQAAPPQGAQ